MRLPLAAPQHEHVVCGAVESVAMAAFNWVQHDRLWMLVVDETRKFVFARLQAKTADSMRL